MGGSQKHAVHFLRFGEMDCDSRKLPPVDHMMRSWPVAGPDQEKEPSKSSSDERHSRRLSAITLPKRH
eukprot:3025722-Karenia_brevis.AAC.1